MRSQIRFLGWLACVLCLDSGAPALALRADASPGADAPGAQNVQDIAHDVALAREALRKSGVDAATLPVQSARTATWPDSSLGCGKPGMMSSQVLTRGREIEFRAPERTYVAHVSAERVVLCDGASRLGVPGVRYRNLGPMIDEARAMLSKMLGVAPGEITQGEVVPREWSDERLDCPSQAASAAQSSAAHVAGFRIELLQAGRSYVFHTDLKRVFPCPPIESR